VSAWVVFHKETGQILLAHTEATLEGEPRVIDRDELIEQYLAARAEEKVDPGELDVLELSEEELWAEVGTQAEFRVDPKSRTLTRHDR
jgi:hypothetical protein